MKRPAWLMAAFFAPMFWALVLSAQSGDGGYRFTMTYSRPGLSVPHWQIVLPEQGPAQYTGKPAQGVDPGTILFAVSHTGRSRLRALLDKSNQLQPCETRTKGIANMGQKDVVYMPSGGMESRCSFNFTENKSLNDAAEYVMAIVNTIQTGVELDRLHRYDRLGLDAVMLRLAEDVKTHRAEEMGAIQPTLQRLVEDEAVMERVRLRAQQLLDMAKMEAAQ